MKWNEFEEENNIVSMFIPVLTENRTSKKYNTPPTTKLYNKNIGEINCHHIYNY